MTTERDLSGSWSVAAFHRACAAAHLDLHAFHGAWVSAYIDREDLFHEAEDCPRALTACGPVPPNCCPTLTACLPLPPACGPALMACGGVPPGWPEAAAQRLVVAMIKAKEFQDHPFYSPYWGPQPYRDTIFTDAKGRIVYHDGFDDLRAWMEELSFEEEDEPIDPPGSLRPLVEYVSLDTLTGRIGSDRMQAFVTKLREEGPGPGDTCYYYFRKAALLGRYAGLRYENVAMLEQAHRDAAEARAGEARYQQWRGEPPLPDDTPPDESD